MEEQEALSLCLPLSGDFYHAGCYKMPFLQKKPLTNCSEFGRGLPWWSEAQAHNVWEEAERTEF